MILQKIIPLAVALLVAAASPGVRAADHGDGPSLLVPVDKMRLVLVSVEDKVVGSLQFDMAIEARDQLARERIALLMPRIRDAILTRLPAQEVTGRGLTSTQLQDTKRRIITLVEQTVGKASVADIQLVKSYVQPA